MKLKLQSTLMTPYHHVDWMEEGQLIFQSGNSLCIKDITKQIEDFITLSRSLSHLHSFVVSPNHKCIFTAEQLSSNSIEICTYTLYSERKSFKISQHPSFIPLNMIQQIRLLPDEFDSSIVYGYASNKNQACIFLVDMMKLKLTSIGYTNAFDTIKICSNDTYAVSISGKGFLKVLRAQDGSWVAEQKLHKKLQNLQIIGHEEINGGRHLLLTSSSLLLLEDSEIIRTIDLNNGENSAEKLLNLNNKLFLVFMAGISLKMFIIEGQNEELVPVEGQNWNLPKGQKIEKVALSRHQEQILLQLENGELYHWKIQDLLENIKNEFTIDFQTLSYPYLQDQDYTYSISAKKNLLLLSNGKKVILWNLIKNIPIITSDFQSLQAEKPVRACAINPDGHSFCLAFPDRIKFYSILINKFQQCGEMMIKKCTFIEYCHGGQYIACSSGRGSSASLILINCLTLKELHTYKINSPASSILWNENDNEIYVSGDSGTISLFKVESQSKIQDFNFKDNVRAIHSDHNGKKVLVSVGKEIHVIDENRGVNVYKPKIPDFSYVFPVDSIYLGADKNGGVYISSSLEFQKHSFIQLFPNKNFTMKYRNGLLIAQGAGSQIVSIKVKLQDEGFVKQQQEIVFVEVDEVNKFFEKIKIIENNFEQYQIKTVNKIDDEKKRYEENLRENTEKFENEISFMQKRLQELQISKVHQEKDNGRVFDELEEGQIKNLNEIERMYDLKIKLQKQKYLSLEQDNLEQKMKYEKVIAELEKRYHIDIEKVRREYSDKLLDEMRKIEDKKSTELQYKKKMELKLINLEEQNELTLLQLQKTKDNTIKDLIEKKTKIERETENILVAQHSLKQDYNELLKQLEQSLQKLKRSQKSLEETTAIVAVLEQETTKKDQIIQEKDQTIKQQAQQIDGLEKAKYVLTFRRIEVRNQLQPKEQIIDNLRSELLKLDGEYKAEIKKNFELDQKIQKLEKAAAITKKENNEFKINLKHKESQYRDLCSEIYDIINETDDIKERNKRFLKVYEQYIKNEKIKKKNKQGDNTSQQINRHLIHVEKSLQQVATGNEKVLKGKEKEVFRKMKENAELVYDINLLRKEKNAYLKELAEKETKISKLKREVKETTEIRKSTRANTANTGATRKLISRDATGHDALDLSFKRQSDYLLPEKSQKNRIMSAHRTMIWREESRKEKSKISEIAKELESAKNTIRRQDRMIEELNQRLLGMPEDNVI